MTIDGVRVILSSHPRVPQEDADLPCPLVKVVPMSGTIEMMAVCLELSIGFDVGDEYRSTVNQF